MRRAALALMLALAAGGSPARAEDAPPFVAEGEIVYRGSAAYDAGHVRGPRVNMTLSKDGTWGGNLLGKDVVLTVKPDRITGAGVNLAVSRTADLLTVEGLISGIRVKVKATRDELVARVGNGQLECTRRPDGYWALKGGPDRVAAIRLKGTADRLPDVPLPQWILALVGSV
jgi:hypothetical protein